MNCKKCNRFVKLTVNDLCKRCYRKDANHTAAVLDIAEQLESGREVKDANL